MSNYSSGVKYWGQIETGNASLSCMDISLKCKAGVLRYKLAIFDLFMECKNTICADTVAHSHSAPQKLKVQIPFS